MAGPKKRKDKHRKDHISVDIPDDFVDAISELGDEDGYYDAREGVVEIESLEKAIVDSTEAKIRKAFPSPFGRQCSIFRVHEKFHKMNDRAYSPEVASIGPLHRGEPNLQAMEQYKLIYVDALLLRTAKTKFREQNDEVTGKKDELEKAIQIYSKPTTKSNSRNVEECMGNSSREIEVEEECTVETITDVEEEEEGECIESIRKIVVGPPKSCETEPKIKGWSAILQKCVSYIKRIEKKARKCYLEPITLKSDEFVQMMLIDGLFIIELFRRSVGEVEKDRYDPLFSKIGDLSSLTRDLLLLENQLPMLVLTGLFKVLEVEGETQIGHSLNMLILNFFNDLVPRDEEILKEYSKYKGKHLLDFVANTFHPSPRNEEIVDKYSNYEFKHLLGTLFKKFHPSLEIARETKDDSWKVIPNVTEMKRSGIKFKKGSSDGSFLDIKFSNGELEIPPVIIQDKTEILFRNLIASEQCSDGQVTYMSSYAFFMDCLIDSADDVRLLCSKDIIKNYLGSDKDVSKLFNKLCCEVIIDHSYYSDLCEEINTYCKKDRHIWRATLKRDYCNGPWSTLSVSAGFVLLILTLASTTFALLSFFVHHS